MHPQAFERVGNDRDDDCDADTPDAPVGGLSGRLVAWGHPSGTGLPLRSPGDLPYYSPVGVTSLGDTVRSIASVFRGGFAVDVDGAVWGWGENFNGRIGDGTVTKRSAPVPVLGDRRWRRHPADRRPLDHRRGHAHAGRCWATAGWPPGVPTATSSSAPATP